MNINLDITTNSSAYNPIGAKGQWVQHRFGERKISLELTITQINSILSSIDSTNVTLESVFGDPLDHSLFNQVLHTLKLHNIHATIITYGSNIAALKSALNSNCTVFIKVCDKVFLDTNFDAIVEACTGHNNVMFENTVFKHTNNDVVHDVCTKNNWQYFETPGVLLSGFCTSVIDRQGNWLYDVHSKDSERETLIKTTEAWHRLKMFVKPVVGQSILNLPEIPRSPILATNFISDNADMFVTVSGHIIKNRERAVVFSNALCTDWESKKLSKNEHYEAGVLAVLHELRYTKTALPHVSTHSINEARDFYL
jgi:hypothetical protein